MCAFGPGGATDVALLPPVPPPIAPVFAPARPPLLGRLDRTSLRPTLAVLAIVAAVVFGGQLADAVVQPPSIGTVEIADGITLDPLPGWFAVAGDEGAGSTSLQKADVRLVLAPQAYAGDSAALVVALEEALRGGSNVEEVTFGETIERPLGGRAAAKAGYTAIVAGVGMPVDGELIALSVAKGDYIVLNAYAPQGSLGGAIAEVEAMAAKVRVRR